MKIAIVEDDYRDKDNLSNHIQDYFSQNMINLDLETYTSAEDFFVNWPFEVDIVFLDIMLVKENGIEIASKIRTTNERVIIIFTTSNPQYSLAGYSVDALDYLIKPVSRELLFRILAKAIHRLGDSFQNIFTINNNDGYFVVNAKDILYIEILNRKLIIHTKTGPINCLRTLQYMESVLPSNFFRCHSAFVINLQAVESVQGSDIIIGRTTIPVSKHRRKEFIKALTEHIGDKI